jgi:hypothetical protein
MAANSLRLFLRLFDTNTIITEREPPVAKTTANRESSLSYLTHLATSHASVH